MEGGPEAETFARQRFLKEKEAAEKDDMRNLQARRAESFRKVHQISP